MPAPLTMKGPVGAVAFCFSKSSQNLAVTPVQPGPPAVGGPSEPPSFGGAAAVPASFEGEPPGPPVPIAPPPPEDPPDAGEPPIPRDPPPPNDPAPPPGAAAV